jgi:hypothetical protein
MTFAITLSVRPSTIYFFNYCVPVFLKNSGREEGIEGRNNVSEKPYIVLS